MSLKTVHNKNFSQKVLCWFDGHGRKNLPWQQTCTPYRVWVSEIMLQQTQVATVIPYFNRFTERFPSVVSLGNSDIDTVLYLWSGLGYYSRARNLHKTAQYITQHLGGQFPDTTEKLMELPGIGRSTAGAIASIAMNIKAPVLDGNVKRVLTRYYAVSGWTGSSAVSKKLWQIATTCLPDQRYGHYTQAMMDLGALVCTRSNPRCCDCPLQKECSAFKTNSWHLYPTPKPKKAVQKRKIYMLLLLNSQQQVLLKKHPQQGIWGGLWSLPVFEKMEKFMEEIEFCRSVKIEQQPVIWSTFHHFFTHRELEITPVQMVTDTFVTFTEEEKKSWCWYTPDKTHTLGMPAPVNKLLQQLYCLLKEKLTPATS